MRHHDLMVIGTGSGNSIVNDRFADMDVAIIEEGTFGGTCLNVGCIPTKMFVHTADVASTPRGSSRFGVDEHVDAVRWTDIRDRIFDRIDPIAAGGDDYREGLPYVTVYRQHVRFVGERTVVLPDGKQISADRVVVAAGSRPLIPEIPGLEGPVVHTSDTIMRIDAVPGRLVVIGGGVIAAEMAHVFAGLGSDVTIICPRDRLLMAEDHEVSERFTEVGRTRWTVHASARVTAATCGAESARLFFTGPDGESSVEADLVLVATGRVPNTDTLDAAAGGIALTDDGRIEVDAQQRASVPGVWALGDISNEYQLKHVANHEARVVKHNLLYPDQPITSDHRFVPHAIFSSPQVAAVGKTEQELIASGTPYLKGVEKYADIAYGWAMEDTTGFAKVLADPETKLLIGAHIIGPQASTLIQPIIQAMSFGLSSWQMAREQYWIHPAMPEVVENALLHL